MLTKVTKVRDLNLYVKTKTVAKIFLYTTLF